ncbi:hypothetical protein AB4Z22_39285, partial [Paenibacillus sp. TAF58]
HLLDDRVVAQERATGQEVHTPDILRLRFHLADVIDRERAVLRRVDAEWADLVRWRRHADSACVAALTGRSVLGRTSTFSNAAIRSSAPAALLGMLVGLSATDLRALQVARPELADALVRADPSAIAQWWASLGASDGALSEAQMALVAGIPMVIGALNGLPALVRVEANRANAAAQLARSDERLERVRQAEALAEALTGRRDKAMHDEVGRLKSEIAYLKAAVAGTVQLYVYDPQASRIIEMIG